MKHTERYEQTVERERVLRVNCDRCGAEIPEPARYATRDFDLRFTLGNAWPSGDGDAIGWEVEDLCNACISWLRKTLGDAGVRVSSIDKDW